ncbi:acyl-CoA Delta(11) desaturase-like [Trichogramma pretiosum]|uniref:acyl-CoA Delta(11) desaturase-like n=1 Tax=Trichogramma pretiosum TaxID=7493 RepID=UPI0006C9DAAF|nr:acyl-CoA Delta(11) desaturase-like [Trichogramma pretiosum]XP_014227086.1 acyl-CoA Delta(11) desaturase-like [Trichogramma pretiosum]
MPPNEQIRDICEFESSQDAAVDEGKISEEERAKQAKIQADIKAYEELVAMPFYKRPDIKWFNLYFMVMLHLGALYGFLTFPYFEKKATTVFSIFMICLANFGVAGGIHRLWAHRSYKAKLPLRVILMIAYLSSGQYSPLYWSRDHRVHHKFSETDADPVNAARGFWFSHVGWLTMKRHPEVVRKGKMVDVSDILADPVVQIGEKYFELWRLLFAFIIPILICVYGWNETWYYAILSQAFMRYAFSLNCTWSINSFAHLIGGHPYDKFIMPAENLVMSFFTGGEGWHNYHHTFPWDYKTSEFGNYSLNYTTILLDLFAKIGWAYDMKQPSKTLIENVIKNRGDGTHEISRKAEKAEKAH